MALTRLGVYVLAPAHIPISRKGVESQVYQFRAQANHPVRRRGPHFPSAHHMGRGMVGIENDVAQVPVVILFSVLTVDLESTVRKDPAKEKRRQLVSDIVALVRRIDERLFLDGLE